MPEPRPPALRLYVRRCRGCGRVDHSAGWGTRDLAATAPPWRCPSCVCRSSELSLQRFPEPLPAACPTRTTARARRFP